MRKWFRRINALAPLFGLYIIFQNLKQTFFGAFHHIRRKTFNFERSIAWPGLNKVGRPGFKSYACSFRTEIDNHWSERSKTVRKQTADRLDGKIIRMLAQEIVASVRT